MERPAPHPAAGRAADRDRDRLARPPVRLRGDGDDLVERARDEVGELQLDDWTLALPGCADRGTDEPLFRDRRVDHARLAELVEEAGRHPERTAEGADVLAEEEDAIILAHRVLQRRPDRLEVRDRAGRRIARRGAGSFQVADRRHRRA